MKRISLYFVLLLSLLVVSACANNESNNQVNSTTISNTPTTQNVGTVKDNASPDGSDKSESGDSAAGSDDAGAGNEQISSSDALMMLQEAINWTTKIDNLSYNTYVEDVWNYRSYEDPSVRLERGYYVTHDGRMDKDPAQAHIRGHNLSVTTEGESDDSYTVLEEHHSFSDYYLSKDLGLYYHYDDVDKWFREDLSDEFRTFEHIEEMLQFFMSYPDHLSVSKSEPLDEDEVFEGYTYADYYTITLDLPVDEFVSNIEYLTHNFFTGRYDTTRLADQILTLISRDLTDYKLSMMLDSEYTLVELKISYASTMLDGEEDDVYSYSSETYFFNFNGDPVIIPDEALMTAEETTVY